MKEQISLTNRSPIDIANSRMERKMEDLQIEETFSSLNRLYNVREGSGLQIEMEDFEEMPGFDVTADKRKVAEKKSSFENQGAGTVIGKFMERLLAHKSDTERLFGEDTYSVLGSDYDDLFNGADLVVEVNSGDRVVRFSVDISTGSSASKLDVQKRRFSEGKLAEVKYFKSEYDSSVTSLQNVPHFILQIDPEQVYEFLGKAKPFVQASQKVLLSEIVKDADGYKKILRAFMVTTRRSLKKNIRDEVSQFLDNAVDRKIIDQKFEMNAPYEEMLDAVKLKEGRNPLEQMTLQSLKTLLETAIVLDPKKVTT